MRPCKPRRIGALPPCRRYAPQDSVPEGESRIGLDMLEALRLVDAEGLPQEQAATVMDVSAPTLCRILGEARRQVTTALSQGRAIIIEGGNIMLCEDSGRQRHGHGPHGPHGHGCGRRQGSGGMEAATGRHGGNGALSAGSEDRGRGPGRGQGRGRMGAGACRRGRMAEQADVQPRDNAASEDGAA